MATTSSSIITSSSSSSAAVFENKKRSRGNKTSNRKILEVKEVIQNRSNNDIQIVLEYYDFDVGKTINAFINDDAKEILINGKKNSKETTNGSTTTSEKTNNNDNELNITKTKNTDDGDIDNNNKNKLLNNTNTNINKKSNKLNNNNNKFDKNNNLNSFNNNSGNKNINKNSFNINDLVESIISKYTTNDDVVDSSQITTTIRQDIPIVINSNNIINNNTTINETIKQNNEIKKLNLETNSQLINDTRPSSLELLNNKNEQQQQQQPIQQQQQQPQIQNYLTTQRPDVININANKVLEKSQKDLQRQIVSLNKLTTTFDEEAEKTQTVLSDLFNKLRTLIDEREVQLQKQLNQMKDTGVELFTSRQKKATEFKHAIDRSTFLTDAQVQDLKNDIKHFVSERKLDEELGMTKRFIHDFDTIEKSIKTFGQIIQINSNHYALRQAKLNESNTNSSENNTPSTTPVSTPLLLTTQTNLVDKVDAKILSSSNVATSLNLTNGFKELEINDNNSNSSSNLKVNGQTHDNNNVDFIEIKSRVKRNRGNKYEKASADVEVKDVNGFNSTKNVNPTKVNGVYNESNNNYYRQSNRQSSGASRRQTNNNSNNRNYVNSASNGFNNNSNGSTTYKQHNNGYNNMNGNSYKMNGNGNGYGYGHDANIDAHLVDIQSYRQNKHPNTQQSNKLNGN